MIGEAGLFVRGTLAVIAALGLSGGGIALDDGPATRFDMYHFASHVEGEAFREVFLVHAIEGPAPPVEDVQVYRDGRLLPVSWDAGSHVDVGDTLSFVQEAYDAQQTLTAVVAGQLVMECRYGGGAGVSIHPDEWRELGLAQHVRCLDELSDF